MWFLGLINVCKFCNHVGGNTIDYENIRRQLYFVKVRLLLILDLNVPAEI